MSDGFLSRWSRRKLDVREGRPVEEPAPQVPTPANATAGAASPAAAAVPPAASVPPGPAGTREPGVAGPAGRTELTLEDTRSLTAESDFRPFVSRAVDPQVRNAAMKKLFADPHFNTMDMLDTYVDDYSVPDPLPQAVVRQLAGARILGLAPDEPEHPASAVARDDADDPQAQSVAESPSGPTDASAPTADANPDLRLQQNDAPGPQSPGQRPQ